MSTIKLIVGLGNPGQQYEQTRHNAGAWYLQALAAKSNIPLSFHSKFFAHIGRGYINQQEVRLAIPDTYMNHSGKAVAAIVNFYRIEPSELLIAFDELDFAPGIAKLKFGGSCSQNGIRDTVSRLGNQKDFWRLRIGIGHPGNKSQVTGHVLGVPSLQDKQNILSSIDEAVTCTELLMKEGTSAAQQRLNAFSAS